MLARGFFVGRDAKVAEVFPQSKTAHEDIPEPARTYLKQAIDSEHAPDGAAMLACSAVDAMLKTLGYRVSSTTGSNRQSKIMS